MEIDNGQNKPIVRKILKVAKVLIRIGIVVVAGAKIEQETLFRVGKHAAIGQIGVNVRVKTVQPFHVQTQLQKLVPIRWPYFQRAQIRKHVERHWYDEFDACVGENNRLGLREYVVVENIRLFVNYSEMGILHYVSVDFRVYYVSWLKRVVSHVNKLDITLRVQIRDLKRL